MVTMGCLLWCGDQWNGVFCRFIIIIIIVVVVVVSLCTYVLYEANDDE